MLWVKPVVLLQSISSSLVSSKNNKKAQGESHFSALVILLCFIGGYLPSRVFGFNYLSVFVLPLYLVLTFQHLYTDTTEYSIAQNHCFFKL